jgi:hypothetical protein
MVNIFNVYNKVGTNILSILTEAIGASDPPKETIVLRDFNLHHPLWLIAH